MPTLAELLASGKYSKRAAQKTGVKTRAEGSPEQREALSQGKFVGYSVIIDGVEYQSLAAASRAVGVGASTIRNIWHKKDGQPLTMKDFSPPKVRKSKEPEPPATDHLGNVFKTRKDMVHFYAWFYKTSWQKIRYRLRTLPLKEALNWPGRPWRQDYSELKLHHKE